MLITVHQEKMSALQQKCIQRSFTTVDTVSGFQIHGGGHLQQVL